MIREREIIAFGRGFVLLQRDFFFNRLTLAETGERIVARGKNPNEKFVWEPPKGWRFGLSLFGENIEGEKVMGLSPCPLAVMGANVQKKVGLIPIRTYLPSISNL